MLPPAEAPPIELQGQRQNVSIARRIRIVSYSHALLIDPQNSSVLGPGIRNDPLEGLPAVLYASRKRVFGREAVVDRDDDAARLDAHSGDRVEFGAFASEHPSAAVCRPSSRQREGKMARGRDARR